MALTEEERVQLGNSIRAIIDDNREFYDGILEKLYNNSLKTSAGAVLPEHEFQHVAAEIVLWFSLDSYLEEESEEDGE